MTSYPFSILRAMPDQRRGETVNIGLVVFLPDHLDVRVLPNLHKLRAIDPRVDLDALATLPDELQALSAHLADPVHRHAMLSHLPNVSVSDLGYLKCRAADYEREVTAIMDDLVTPPARPRQAPAGSRLVRSIKAQFGAMRLLGSEQRDIDAHKVVHRFPVSADQNLYADFVLKNGSWHVTETLDLRVRPQSVRTDKFKQACEKAVTLDQAHKHLKGDFHPVVVIAASDEAMEIAQPHLNLLSNYTDRIYNYLDRDDIAAYFAHMARAAGGGAFQ